MVIIIMIKKGKNPNKWVSDNAIAHLLLSGAKPHFPAQTGLSSRWQPLFIEMHGSLSVQYPVVQFKSPLPAKVPHSFLVFFLIFFLYISSVAEHGTMKEEFLDLG